MSEPEISMDGLEHPDHEPGRRADLSALAWRAPAEAPSGAGNPLGANGAADPARDADPGATNGTSAVQDTWTPPEPWTPPAWTPPEWPPAASPAPAAEPSPWAPPAEARSAEPVEAEIVAEPVATPPPVAAGSAFAGGTADIVDAEIVSSGPSAEAPVSDALAPEAPAFDASPSSSLSNGYAAGQSTVDQVPEGHAPGGHVPGGHAPGAGSPTVDAGSPWGASAFAEPSAAPASWAPASPEPLTSPPAPPHAVTSEPPVPSMMEPSTMERPTEAPVAPELIAIPEPVPPATVPAEQVTPAFATPEPPVVPVVPGPPAEPAAAFADQQPPDAAPAAAPPPPAVSEPSAVFEPPVFPEPPAAFAPPEFAPQPPSFEPPSPPPAAAFEPPSAAAEPPSAAAEPESQPTAPAPAQPEPESAVAEPPSAPAASAGPSDDDLPPIEAILPPAEGYREVGFDTVIRAVHTEREFQPYLELGLQHDEYARIRAILGRRPTESELAMYAVMWSEHCSYKSSKVHLRQFGEIPERITAQGDEHAENLNRMLAGMGANAGVVKVSDSLAVTFKIESHNHPSFVEPHQGAATGVGGIVRDILAMGARPVAVLDPLRFGAIDHEDTRRVLPGVVAGIGGYGNCLGLPTIGGEVVFDECYQGNPLVNALCIGVLPIDKLQQKAANGPGNIVVLIGAKTGRDGIGGVSVLASAEFGQGSESRRPSVQVGDPFLEKLLIEACLELYDLGLVSAIQDLGGAGLTCALSEMSAAAGLGMAINLDLVPLREPSMRSEEILVSESQERMLLVVTPEDLPVVLSICARWGVLATAIGEVTAPEPEIGPRLRIWWRGEVVVDVPPGSLADDGPVYDRPMREPYDRELMKVDRPETLPRPESPADLRETLLRMAGSPNLCDKSWVTEQYDRYVLGNTVLAQPEDGGVIRIDESTGLGVAVATDGNGRYARLDPYAGARLALAEAYRNVAVTGATPVAVTNCLNFGSPEDPGVMWQFAEAVRGLADGCVELGLPVTGGNVSFYNQTGGNAINPTPIVGVLGVLDNVARRVPIGFSGEGDPIFLLGQTREEFGGSEWAHVVHGHLGGTPPTVDLAAERRLAALLAEAASLGLLTAAHDLSEGGLAQALVESCLRRNMGAHVALPPDGQSAFVHLFSESTGRAIVSVRKGQEQAFAALADERGVPKTALGIVTAPGTALVVDELFEIGLDELRLAHAATLPTHFG